MSTGTVRALGLTLVSAAAINWGYLLEHGAASQLPPLSVPRPVGTVRALFGSRRWLLGFSLETSGFILQVVALALAPLALVQSVAAGGIGVLALLVARISHTPLQAREAIGVAISIAGLAALLGYFGGKAFESAPWPGLLIALGIGFSVAPWSSDGTCVDGDDTPNKRRIHE